MILICAIIGLCLSSNLKAENNLNIDSRCGPNNQGVCTLIINCPEAIEKLKQKQELGLETCGYYGRLEIVCCMRNSPQSPELRARKSMAACQKYSKNYSISLQPFIINGENVAVGEFPYMAAVGYPGKTKDEIKWECGGILISERFILTAAHCLARVDKKLPSIVRLGKIDLFGVLDKATAQDIPVEEIIVHPKYHPLARHNDIGLLRLATSAEFNGFVKPVCLNNKPRIKGTLSVLGWGVVNIDTEERSRILQKAAVQLYDLKKCNETYFGASYGTPIHDTQLCAFSHDPMRADTCQGDSGGPVQIANRRSIAKTPNIVVGITSYGRGCGGVIPSVYTRVSSYLDWIEGIHFLDWGNNDLLLKSTLVTVDKKQCNEDYPSVFRQGIPDSYYCGLTGSHICSTSSGSPAFLTKGDDSRATVVGLSTYGNKCGSKIPTI
ncbi:Trypsin [Popillia japonica]|uniref:Trypsin n=1 Tax=Popillia japonica TaxID=7064 RepID=A0AAW1KIP5_POPJA